MNAETQIRNALKKIMTDGEANSCRIWKSYDAGTGLTGWHIAEFGHGANYYGKNLADALATIEDTATERAETYL